MTRVESIDSLVKALRGMMRSSHSQRYIHDIRFPHYRNLEANTCLELPFPVAALVGPNGSGKTAVLQALYGTTSKTSVGRFWFATSVDPIDEKGGRPSIVYGYRPDGVVLRDVLKTRILREQRGQLDPDYWEPSRVLKSLSMRDPPPGRDRTDVVSRPCLYINFRYYQSAFDRVFYKQIPPEGRTRDYLRRVSKFVRSTLDDPRVILRRGVAQNKKPVEISRQILSDVSRILGKDYVKATHLHHRFFGREWGDTAIYDTKNFTYSNAYAGSGELAVLYLATELHNAGEETLVLLDEPETSLHPRAQQELLCLLLRLAKEKRLQIVFSTHAPRMIEGLPPEAISVFIPAGHEKHQIISNVHYSTAFDVIGQPIDRPKLIVEDILAKKIVLRAMKGSRQKLENFFAVEYQPGGAQNIFQRCVVYAEDSKRYAVILDGDQRPKVQGAGILDTLEGISTVELDKVIKRLTGSELRFHVDGNSRASRANEEQSREVRIKFLQFYRERIRFLPGVPEVMITDLSELDGLMNLSDDDLVKAQSMAEKDRMVFLAKKNGWDITTVQDLLVTQWAKKNPDELQKLCDAIHELAGS